MTPQAYVDHMDALCEGKVGMILGGSWSIGRVYNYYPDMVGKIGVAEMPTIDGDQSGVTSCNGGWTYVISSKTSEEKREKAKSIEEGVEISYDVGLKILDFIGKSEYKEKTYKGATNYFFQKKERNAAVDKIIEIARANDKTTVIAIGAITNVALALYFEPSIAEKINIIWLGGNALGYAHNREYNFIQDVEAVDFTFKSGAKIDVVPCKNVAAQLTTTIYELEHYLLGGGKIGEYLCDVFRDCKKFFRACEEDIIGESKTLWDLSAVAYAINPQWFEVKTVSRPEILEDSAYKLSEDDNKITFAYDLSRHRIFQDFFIKMGKND